ncbi:phosphoenolpyruvate carboxykinase [GTP]-like [Rhinoraja longicauda]
MLNDYGKKLHSSLLLKIEQFASLTNASDIFYCDGSDEENSYMLKLLEEKGTIRSLSKRPGSYIALSDPDDVSRVEDKTFICSEEEKNSGPTNNWCHPDKMEERLTLLYKGCMKGKSLYVIPFSMGNPDGNNYILGIELTDSAYVVANMRVMTRVNKRVIDKMSITDDVTMCYHSVGCPIKEGQKESKWPCNIKNCVIAHFPQYNKVCSYGSGYGGNSLLGKKSISLRMASVVAKNNGWLAEHMLILCLESPDGQKHYIGASFPSACGKTNLSMSDIPDGIDGYKITTVGDDIAWIKPGSDGRLYAMNPEHGFFGVVPGTSYKTNPTAMDMLKENAIFTNTAYTDDGDVWWEGIGYPAPKNTMTWKNKLYDINNGELGSHPNARFTVSVNNCKKLSEEYDNPNGVPLDIILFGGRVSNIIPLATKSKSWAHGVFMGATMASESTHSATSAAGVMRRDPFSMLPFCGYHILDYFNHWLSFGDAKYKLPSIYYVNWFRKDKEGKYIWPGFAENIRILLWAIKEHENPSKIDSAIGLVPKYEDINTNKLNISKDKFNESTHIDYKEYLGEINSRDTYLKSLGDNVPKIFLDIIKQIKDQIS